MTGAGRFDGVLHRLSFVRSQIVKHDEIVGLESWGQEMLDICGKTLAVDRPVDEAPRLDAVAAQDGEKGPGVPMPMRNLIDERSPRGVQP